MKYKALVLDHDDTSVKSTPEIHYPAFLKTLERLRPGEKLSLEDFIGYNFGIGFLAMCNDVYHFTAACPSCIDQYSADHCSHRGGGKAFPKAIRGTVEANWYFECASRRNLLWPCRGEGFRTPIRCATCL